MTAHSNLGASNAHRWMACPGSVALTRDMANSSSAYAEEGTQAHRLAELCLLRRMDAVDLPDSEEWAEYPQEMREYVQQYLDQVRAIHAEAGGTLLVEQRLDYSEWVPGGFGTADAVIIADRELIVIDLKYGAGVRVDAPGNPQSRLYCLGAYSEHELGHDFQTVTGVIIQPRMDHYSSETLTISELLDFANLAGKAAQAALSDNAPLVPGEKQCRWCEAKGVCRARAEKNLRVAQEEFAEPVPEPATLSHDEIGELLPRLAEIEAWAKDVRAYALQQAVNGANIKGHKVVEGRSARRWTSRAQEALNDHPEAERLYSRKLVGIGEAEKILGKRSDLLATLTEKPPGKPTLAPEHDRRPAVQGVNAAKADFAE